MKQYILILLISLVIPIIGEAEDLNDINTQKFYCENGYSAGCSAVAQTLINSHISSNYATALEYSEKACSTGSAYGCYILGLQYDKGYGVAINYHEAYQYYKKSCDKFYWLGCSNLGVMYDYGLGVGINPRAARSSYLKACDHNIAQGCLSYAYMYTEDKNFPKNTEIAEEYSNLYKQMTENKRLAQKYFDEAKKIIVNKGLNSKTVDKIISFATESCDYGNGMMCTNLTAIYQDKSLGVIDPEKVDYYADQACFRESSPGCMLYARLLVEKKDPTKKDILTSESINLWNCYHNYGRDAAISCFNQGVNYINQHRGSDSRVLGLFKRACDADFAPGCHNLGVYDPSQAKKYFGKACKLGFRQSCDMLKSL